MNTQDGKYQKYFGCKGRRPLKEVLLFVFYRYLPGALSRFSDGPEQSSAAELHRTNLTTKSNRIRQVRGRYVLMAHLRTRVRTRTRIPVLYRNSE